MITIDKTFNPNTFSHAIEECVHQKGMGYLEAIMWFVESNNIEVEAVVSLLKKCEVIRLKLQAECEDSNIIQKASTKLPL